MIEKVTTEEIHFRERVLKMEAHITFAKKSSVLFQLKLKDMYDLQDLQCDILSGVFLHRFVSWLQDDGFKINKELVTTRITGVGPVQSGWSC